MVDTRAYAVDDILRDGSPVHIRAIRPSDRQLLADGFHGLSDRSVYLRFFRSKNHLTERELSYFTTVDFARHVALVALVRERHDERVVGVGRYVASGTSNPAKRAEVACTVADDYQGRGLGSLLLKHLASIARANDICEFEAFVLGENRAMLRVLEDSGFKLRRSIMCLGWCRYVSLSPANGRVRQFFGHCHETGRALGYAQPTTSAKNVTWGATISRFFAIGPTPPTSPFLSTLLVEFLLCKTAHWHR